MDEVGGTKSPAGPAPGLPADAGAGGVAGQVRPYALGPERPVGVPPQHGARPVPALQPGQRAGTDGIGTAGEEGLGSGRQGGEPPRGPTGGHGPSVMSNSMTWVLGDIGPLSPTISLMSEPGPLRHQSV